MKNQSRTSHGDRDYRPAMDRDALLPLYDVVSRVLGASSLHRQLTEQAEIGPGHRVLEVGCGTGNLTLLAKRMQPGADFAGLDPDPRALARARRKTERRTSRRGATTTGKALGTASQPIVRMTATTTDGMPDTGLAGVDTYMHGVIAFAQAVVPGSATVIASVGDERNASRIGERAGCVRPGRG
jgi:SAM-dependent methyltransferase